MRPVKFDDFVRLANCFYLTIGIRPYSEPGRLDQKPSLLDNIIFYYGVINMNLMFLGECGFVVRSFVGQTDFVEAILVMSYMGFVLVGEIKMMSVYRKKAQLSELVSKLQEMFPRENSEQETLQTRRYVRQCTFVTVSFSVLYMLLIWTYNLFAIMEWLIYNCWLNIRAVEKTLPYTIYVPWNWHDSWTFYLLYFSLDLAGFTSAVGQISSDLLFCAVATQVIMHYDHIARTIEGYDLRASNATTNASQRHRLQEEDLKFLNRMVCYHDKVLNLSKIMNDVFGMPLLFNFMIGSFVICFVGFQMTIGNTTMDMQIKLFLFLVSSLAQVYLICHYGQLLSDASTGVAHSVYHQNWYNADVRYKKMLVLIAARAQNPAYLKATTFVTISRTTMTDIMQISYQFFALLRTMYSH